MAEENANALVCDPTCIGEKCQNFIDFSEKPSPLTTFVLAKQTSLMHKVRDY